MEEYDPDRPIQEPAPDKRRKIKIGNVKPFSPEYPKFPERYAEHQSRQTAFMICPECKHLGLHKPTDLNGTIRMGGYCCDICGYEDTYEIYA